jgi:hypothetical protein
MFAKDDAMTDPQDAAFPHDEPVSPVIPRRVRPRLVQVGQAPAARPTVPRLALRRGALALIAMGQSAREQEVARWIERGGGTAVAVPSEAGEAATLADAADRWDFALIDSDAFGDPAEAHDLCLRLRNAAPGLPIILVDSELYPRDLTPLASGLCDALLPPDFSESSLAHAHQTATFAASFVRTDDLRDAMHGPALARLVQAPRRDAAVAPRSAPSGWWIVPAVLLGAAMWVALGVALLAR